MGFFASLFAKAYGQVLEGDYKGCKVGAKWATDNYFFIIPMKGSMIKITKNEIESFDVQPVNAFGVANVKIQFKDGKKSLIQFSREGMEIFNRTTF